MRVAAFPEREQSGILWQNLAICLIIMQLQCQLIHKADIYLNKLIIQLVSLMELGDAVGIIHRPDCKFYTTVSLQLCKFTAGPLDANYADE